MLIFFPFRQGANFAFCWLIICLYSWRKSFIYCMCPGGPARPPLLSSRSKCCTRCSNSLIISSCEPATSPTEAFLAKVFLGGGGCTLPQRVRDVDSLKLLPRAVERTPDERCVTCCWIELLARAVLVGNSASRFGSFKDGGRIFFGLTALVCSTFAFSASKVGN